MNSEKENSEMAKQALIESMKDPEFLPNHNDVRSLFREGGNFHKELELPIFEVFTREYIDKLGSYLVERIDAIGRKKKGPVKVLEVAAGNGRLSHLIRREIVALGESRRTEGFWSNSRIFDASGKILLAEVLLHQAFFKNSYPHYPTT